MQYIKPVKNILCFKMANLIYYIKYIERTIIYGNQKEIKNMNEAIRMMAEGYYGYQEIRKAQYNRIRDVVRKKIENIPMDKKEEKKERKEYLKKFDDKKIIKYLKKLEEDDKVEKHEHKYLTKLFDIVRETKTTEGNYKILMMNALKKEEIWCRWLINIRGISSVLGSTLLNNFGYCEDYKYVSSLWRHTGYDPDGAQGKQLEGGIHYSPELKTFIWKISDSLMKQRTPVYREIYDGEKRRQKSVRYTINIKDERRIVGDILDEKIGDMKKGTTIYSKKGRDNYKKLVKNAEEEGKKEVKIRLSDGHIHSRALRKMVKVFMQHYWMISRKMKDIEISKPYPHEKLGHISFIKPPFDPFDGNYF